MTNPLNIADSFLPNFDFDQDKKRLYLSYRLCGFSRDEAMDMAEISRRTLYHWRQKDADFDTIERKSLPELKHTFTRELLFWLQVRNLRLLMQVDSKLLDKAVTEPEKLSRREMGQIKAMRSTYSTPQAQVWGGG